MSKKLVIEDIRRDLNLITNRLYEREDLALAYQLGFLLAILAAEMSRDSGVRARFSAAAERARRRPRC